MKRKAILRQVFAQVTRVKVRTVWPRQLRCHLPARPRAGTRVRVTRQRGRAQPAATATGAAAGPAAACVGIIRAPDRVRRNHLEASGQDSGVRIISSAIDDWCGNGRPPIPIPWPGPWPFAFSLDAAPKELDVAASRLVGALSLAAVASRMGKGKVQEALSAGADKLLEASVGPAAK